MIAGSAACIVSGHTIANGYTDSLLLNLKPSTVTNGRVTAFSATELVNATSTATGRQHNCKASSETFAFHSR